MNKSAFPVRRITICVARDTSALLDREAFRQGVSLSEVVRRMIARVYKLDPQAKRRVSFAALGRSGKKDTARNVDAILSREWGEKDRVTNGGGAASRTRKSRTR